MAGIWVSIGWCIAFYTMYVLSTLLTLDFIDACEFMAIQITWVMGVGFLYIMFGCMKDKK